MKKMNKKGFTVVELVIVIAVIAVLAAVLIPTFAGILHKADVSNDTQLVKNLNTALAADTTKNVTMTDALEAAAEFGYDIEKINASATDNEILWDSANNLFCYFNEGKIEYIPEANRTVTDVKDHQYWVISDTIDAKYSTYYTGVALTGDVAISKGFDAGVTDTSAAIVTYTNTGAAQTVAIRMNGGKLVVDAENDTVNKFGEAEFVDIKAVAMASFHEYGKTQFTQIAKGNYVVEATGYTNAIVDNSTVAGAVTISTERAIGGAEIPKYIISEIKEENPEANVEDIIANIQAGATDFAGGEGTEANPYLIETAEHMLNIGKYVEAYSFFKVKDGVSVIDVAGSTLNVDLVGSFDGNGVTFKNLNSSVFHYVYGDVTMENGVGDVYVKNFAVEFGAQNNSGVVYRNYAKNFTMEDVAVHGYIEDTLNTASFLDYAGPGNDVEIHVTLKNCTSDATVVIVGNPVGAYVGHPFSNANSTFNFDNCAFEGKLYSTNACNLYFAGWCNGTVFVDGEQLASANIAVSGKNIETTTIAAPEKYDVFTVNKVTGFDHATAYLTIGPNGNGTTVKGGYYCGEYIIETSAGEDATLVVDETTISTSQIKFFDITSNGDATTETGISADGKIFNVVNDNYNNEIGGASVKIVQYDSLGNILSVATFKIV